jgi:hypothetical protein
MNYLTSSVRNPKKEAESRLELVQSKIDWLVYELYGLTEEEIKIVEGETA